MFSHTQKMHTNTCGVANHTLMMQDMVRATPFPGKFSQFCPINHHLPLKNLPLHVTTLPNTATLLRIYLFFATICLVC